MKTPKQILERRKSIRIHETLPIRIGHEGFELEAHSVNISAHGAMCAVERDIPLMTRLKVAFQLPPYGKGSSKKKQLKITGVVVRKEAMRQPGRFYIAVYFSDIKPADQALLNEFIGHRLSS